MDVSKIKQHILACHDKVVCEAKSRCTKYADYMSEYHENVEQTADDSNHDGNKTFYLE